MNPPSSHRFRHFLRRFTTSIAVVRQWCARGGFSFHIYTHNTAIVDSSLLFLCPFSFVSFFPFLLLLLLPISINIPSQPASTHRHIVYNTSSCLYRVRDSNTKFFAATKTVMDLRASLSPSPISIRVLQECLVFTPWPFSKKKKKKRQELLIFIFFKFSYLTAVRLYSFPLYRWRNES